MIVTCLLAAADDGGSILQTALEWFELDDPGKRLLIAFGLLGQFIVELASIIG